MKTKVSILLTVLLACGCLSACSLHRDPIVGYWAICHRVFLFRPWYPEVQKDPTLTGPLLFHFQPDHTLVVSGKDAIYTYQWRWVESNAIEIKGDISNGTYQAELKGDTFTIHNFYNCSVIDSVRVSEPPAQAQCRTEFP